MEFAKLFGTGSGQVLAFIHPNVTLEPAITLSWQEGDLIAHMQIVFGEAGNLEQHASARRSFESMDEKVARHVIQVHKGTEYHQTVAQANFDLLMDRMKKGPAH